MIEIRIYLIHMGSKHADGCIPFEFLNKTRINIPKIKRLLRLA